MVDRYNREKRTRSRVTKRHVLRVPDEDAVLFEAEEHMFTTDDGPGVQMEVEQGVMLAEGCGHFVGFTGPEELVGSCMIPGCGLPLCFRCGEAMRCGRCLRVCCQQHLVLLEGTGRFCRRCKHILLAKRYTIGLIGSAHAFLNKDF